MIENSKRKGMDMNDRIQTLATIARKMMLTASQAIALPAVIERAAAGQGMAESEMLAHCMNNGGVCEYLASICRKVA